MPMITHKIIPSVNYNKWLKRLNTQLNELTKKNSIKVPKVGIYKKLRKRYFKTLVTRVINSPMSPPSPIVYPTLYYQHTL